MSEYYNIRRKVIFEMLDKFPNAGTRTIARMLYRDNPVLFASVEQARKRVLYYRGAMGEASRRTLKIKKYVRKQIQPT